MIKGVHTMFYSSRPDELRAFFRDKLRFPFTDVGGGWLIFDLPAAVHDAGYGLVTHFKVPGDFQVQLYKPKYEKRTTSAAK